MTNFDFNDDGINSGGTCSGTSTGDSGSLDCSDRFEIENDVNNFGVGNEINNFFEGSGRRPDVAIEMNGVSASDRAIKTQQQQQHFSHGQEEIPIVVSSTNDFREINSTPIFSRHEPQHLKIKDHNHDIDVLLAKELNQLSFHERNTINEEIHGVSSLKIDETPELISRSLERLQFEMKHNIPMHKKMAYERSQELSRSSSSPSPSDEHGPKKPRGYINDSDFLIAFLRCDRFDVRRAANRLATFMELVYELWGEIALTTKTWTMQSHYSDFERKVMQTAMYQIFQGRDRAGRRIAGNFALHIDGLTVENRLRLSMYIAMTVAEDIETQKKGAVMISMWHNMSIDDIKQRGQTHAKMRDAFPIRISAIHFCLPYETSSVMNDSNGSKKRRYNNNPQFLQLLKAMFIMSIGAELRPHLRVHVGSTVECIYALQSFGILPEQIPFNAATHTIKTKYHLKWLELKLQKEKALEKNKHFNKIECPMIQDVLFGRGWPIMKHPGNVLLRNIINLKLEEYKNEKTKRGKTMIAHSVVWMVKNRGKGGRFLKEDSGWWVEVSNDMARQKVSIAFRDARKLKSNQTRSMNSSANGQAQKSTNEASARSNSRSGAKQKEDKNFQVQTDSSTSVFLGMDGITGIKRQRCFA